MASVIHTNVASLNSQRTQSAIHSGLNTSMQRLSSGLRINSAKDDAAGLQISEKMMAQLRTMTQQVRESNDMISLSQTAEGTLGQVSSMLQRSRELMLQRDNPTLGEGDRQAVQAELSAQSEEIARMAKTTSFNGQKLLDGSFQGQASASGAGGGVPALGDVSTLANFETLEDIDKALETVSSMRADLGAAMNTASISIDSALIHFSNTSSSASRLRDTDFAQEASHLVRKKILEQANTAMLAQANAMPQQVLRLLRG